MKNITSGLWCFALAVVLLAGVPQQANAQNQSQWDSLFDRIIRLEADVRNMRSNAGSQGGGGASPQIDQRLYSLESQMQQLLGEMRTLNDRLRALEAQRSGAAPANNSNQLAQAGAVESESLPLVDQDLNSYAQGNGNTQFVFQPGAGNTGGAGTQASQGFVPQTPTQQGAVPAYNESVEVATLDGESVTGIANASGPQQLYEQSYASIRSKEYSAAETGFKAFLSQYGSHKLAGNAQYWLGQSYYARGNYQQAAREFLTGYQSYKKSKKAPASLLKLGMSLDKLGQKKQACATLAQVRKQYPKAKNEQKQASKAYRRAGC